jgi:hypothetical protein
MNNIGLGQNELSSMSAQKSVKMAGPQEEQTEKSWMSVLPAITQVESKGDPKAIGDKGKALGLLQIHNVMVQEVNRIGKTKFTHKDALKPDIATKMYDIYMAHYVPKAEQKLGRPLTPGEIGKLWNGGPAGLTKQSTEKYAQKVEAAMQAEAPAPSAQPKPATGQPSGPAMGAPPMMGSPMGSPAQAPAMAQPQMNPQMPMMPPR